MSNEARAMRKVIEAVRIAARRADDCVPVAVQILLHDAEDLLDADAEAPAPEPPSSERRCVWYMEPHRAVICNEVESHDCHRGGDRGSYGAHPFAPAPPPEATEPRLYRPRSWQYAHMCRDEHEQIGHNDSENEMCPLCRVKAENEALRAERDAMREGGEEIAPREALAALAHEQWAGWMRHLFETTTEVGDECEEIPRWAVTRWKRQMATAYADLPEDEKESDRKEADRVLAVVQSEVARLLGGGAKPKCKCGANDAGSCWCGITGIRAFSVPTLTDRAMLAVLPAVVRKWDSAENIRDEAWRIAQAVVAGRPNLTPVAPSAGQEDGNG